MSGQDTWCADAMCSRNRLSDGSASMQRVGEWPKKSTVQALRGDSWQDVWGKCDTRVQHVMRIATFALARIRAGTDAELFCSIPYKTNASPACLSLPRIILHPSQFKPIDPL